MNLLEYVKIHVCLPSQLGGSGIKPDKVQLTLEEPTRVYPESQI